MKKLLFFLAAISASFSGCEKAKKESVVEWPYGVKYEVFVMSFADADGNGKGDFKGLTAKLDYLKDLGVNGLWLMPIMPSDTYHKYHVIDYKNIDPDFGTLEDFKEFVDEAHERGIKVITDYVINHTGNLHPWFLEAQKGKDNPYRDYYVWARKDSIRDQMNKKVRTLDSDNIRKWHPVNNDTLGEHYYGYFNGLTPDLNLDNPKVRAEIVDIAKFWLNEIKVDGFRMDAARHIFPDERYKDNHDFWVWFRKEMEAIKPDVYLVGEVWSSADVVAPYLKGLPSLFNFDLGYAITDVAKAGKDTIGLVNKYKEIRDYYKTITTEYLDATFLKNHDQTRLLSELKGDVDKARVAASILLTMPGTPYLYYGEEIGMVGDKLRVYADLFGPDAYVREPYIWDVGRNDRMQTSWEKAQYSTDSTVTPFSKQDKDSQSLLNFYRKLIAVRNQSKALTYGEIEEIKTSREEIVGFRRSHEEETVAVFHNASDTEVSFQVPEDIAGLKDTVYDMNENSKIGDGQITLAPHSTLIVK